ELMPQGDHDPTFLLLADERAMTDKEYPILVLDLFEAGRGQSFRVTASELWSIGANLSIGNIDFEEFADGVDGDGVFRRFPDCTRAHAGIVDSLWPCHSRVRTDGNPRGLGVHRGTRRRPPAKGGDPQATPVMAQPRS